MSDESVPATNFVAPDKPMTVEQWLATRKEAGLLIDPETAEVIAWWGQIIDPYGVRPELAKEHDCVGRLFFARSPGSDIWVSFDDLPHETGRALWERIAAGEFNTPPKAKRTTNVRRCVRWALERHWDASDASDFKVEHEIYREDAVLDYPQSGERIRGRRNIQESRFVQPNKKRFTVRRIVGSGDLWVTEFILTYDGIPSYAVSIMEFREGLVANETQYFADRFDPAPSRAHLVERVA